MSFSAELEQAYRATAYQVTLPCGKLVLRVGLQAPLLDAWLEQSGYREWSLLTAWNPASRLLTDAENRELQELLQQQLRSRGLSFFQAENHSDSGMWPIEASLFVPALRPEEADTLARLFGQNAYLSGNLGFPPRLLWT